MSPLHLCLHRSRSGDAPLPLRRGCREHCVTPAFARLRAVSYFSLQIYESEARKPR